MSSPLADSPSFRTMRALTVGLALITLVLVPFFPELEHLIQLISNGVERWLLEHPFAP